MAKKYNPTWADAYNKCRLNLETIEKAKKLGIAPRTVIASHASTRSQKWKAPVKEWIEDLYEKRFGEGRKGRVSSGKAVGEVKNESKAVVRGFDSSVPWPTDADVPPVCETDIERDWAEVSELLGDS